MITHSPKEVERVKKGLQSLSIDERTRKIIEYRYGTNDGIARSLEAVGRVFGLTRERIRQIEAKFLDTMRKAKI